MRRFFYFILIVIAVTAGASAQRMLGPDTLFYTMKGDIVVSALRLSTSAVNATAPIDVISEAEISAAPARSVSDVLARTPGATLRAYGAGGGLDLVSLRGLEAEYTVVLLNGVRLNNSQITVVDLDKLSLHDVRQIEVARGGYSSLYGADALGGVVNIRTSDAVPPPYVTAGAGSFGYRQYEGGAGTRLGPVSMAVSGFYEEAENDYPFNSLTSIELTRARSNYTRKGVTLRGSYAGSGVAGSLYASAAATDAGTPGALTGIHQGFARQRDGSLVVSAPVHYQAGPTLLLQLTPSAFIARQRYYDPAIRVSGAALDAQYDNAQYGLSLTADHTASKNLSLLYGAEGQFATLASASVSGRPERLSLGAFVAAEWKTGEDGRLRVLPSLRGDVHRDLHDAMENRKLSPSLGARYEAIPGYAALRARYASGYRIPTFNQLYWAQGGNPDVRPESSVSYDAGVRLTHPVVAGLSLDAGMFRHDIENKIVWRPGGGCSGRRRTSAT